MTFEVEFASQIPVPEFNVLLSQHKRPIWDVTELLFVMAGDVPAGS